MSHSSSDEDGDEKWRAAVNSIANDGLSILNNNTNHNGNSSKRDDSDEEDMGKSSTLKLYQTRAQDLLHSFLDKTLTIISYPELQPHLCRSPIVDGDDDDDIHLFKRAPRGVTLKPNVERSLVSIPRKRPKILRRQDIDEKSAEFQCQLQSIAVEGTVILAEAEKNSRKALARLQAREAAAQIAAKKEEERVALLKQQRGEKWLPSVAEEEFGNLKVKKNFQSQLQTPVKKHLDNCMFNSNKYCANGKNEETLSTKRLKEEQVKGQK